jgi:hypothetical protein
MWKAKSFFAIPQDSLVEQARKAGPRGDGNWPGFDHVYTEIYKAAERMSRNKNVHLSEDHIETMGDLGSGHEERMKARLHWLRTYGWLEDKPKTENKETQYV